MYYTNVPIAENVYYVGCNDWEMRDFHGYFTPRGVTYNSYLIKDEKVALIDCVKAPFADELLGRVRQLVEFDQIEYVVVNHVEPDHSSALPEIMRRCRNAKVVITSQGKLAVQKYFQPDPDYEYIVVKEGDSLPLGKNTLNFVPVPMVHWPDSMVSFMAGEDILFSNDAFGQHICTSGRFDDQNDLKIILFEAEKYYANILMPLGQMITKVLPKIKSLPIKLVAPSHGVVWRKDFAAVLALYEKWANGCWDDKVVIVYDTMWKSTDMMARSILDGVASTGVGCKLFKMSVSDRSEVAREMLDAAGIIAGSSTIHNDILPTMGGILTYFRGLQPRGKLSAAFGSYGWSGGAQKIMEQYLVEAKTSLIKSGLEFKWRPTREELVRCHEFGAEFGRKILEINARCK
ncbi:MAG: FprA family A-type flavoprotein [Negativicutes bacterium]|nr:FprA family A-type flavoprotein [Negativicutes bacterium]